MTPPCTDCGEPTTITGGDGEVCPTCLGVFEERRYGYFGWSVRGADYACHSCTLSWCAEHLADPNAAISPVSP